MIDFHNHLLPGVDDGAADIDESRAALLEMLAQGVSTVVVTPHLAASTTEAPNNLARAFAVLDSAYAKISQLAAEEVPQVTVLRGVELMLNSPAPNLSDARLRLAGSSFTLVEFPGMMVPPHSVQALYNLRMEGWRPIVAHPERYRGAFDPRVVEEWRGVGARIQMNSGSVLGRYGDKARKIAWSLLERGLVDYICSDYHARGRLSIAECREMIVQSGGAEQARLLMDENPRRMLVDEEPEAVPGFRQRRSWWRRLGGGS